jgi:P-type Cu+ transporter
VGSRFCDGLDPNVIMAQTSSASSLSAPDAHTCPACGAAVDSLRAGHVAILDGSFKYFCSERCKRDLYLQSSGPRSRDSSHSASSLASGPLPSEVETAEPPPVAPTHPDSEASERSPSRAGLEASATQGLGEGAPTTLPSVAIASVLPSLSESAPATRDKDVAGEGRERVPTLPSIDVTPSTEVDASASLPGSESLRLPAGVHVPPWLVAAGVAFGSFAALLSIVGHGADHFRAPFACLSILVLLGKMLGGKKDAEAPHPAIVVGPILGVLAALAWSVVAHDGQMPALASFAGLAAACALASEWLATRLAEPARSARERIDAVLEGEVRVVRGGQTVRADAFEVKPGEPVGVEAGETLRVDGVVAAGEAKVYPFIGAPFAVKKKEGDSLVAGATVASGRLRVTTTWAGTDRAYFRLALSDTLRTDVAAPLSAGFRRVVERGVPLLGGLGGIAAYAAGARGPLVVATACAVALALAVRGAVRAVALHHAQGQLSTLALGIVYKDASAFDAAGRASVAVLCARGTVLMGEPEIVALESLGSVPESRILAIAAGAEVASTHPFASAILRAARTREERPENVRGAMVHPGLGVTALSAMGERLVVGSRALLLREKVSVAIADARVTELEMQGRSVLLVALAGKLVGLIALQDGLRPGARAAVQRLLDSRLEPVLLSGEARETCETFGRMLDVDHIRPEILPEGRGGEVRALGEGGQLIAVIGRPQTDDGALGAADVSVALGAAGSTPGEWSVSLASDDVRDAAKALSLAKEARDRSKVALVLGVAPGILAALAVGWGLVPIWVSPLTLLVGAVAPLATLSTRAYGALPLVGNDSRRG